MNKNRHLARLVVDRTHLERAVRALRMAEETLATARQLLDPLEPTVVQGAAEDLEALYSVITRLPPVTAACSQDTP